MPDPPSLAEGRRGAGSSAAREAAGGGGGGGGDSGGGAAAAWPWSEPRSESDGLRLLDPEDSLWFNPSRALEELVQIGAGHPARPGPLEAGGGGRAQELDGTQAGRPEPAAAKID